MKPTISDAIASLKPKVSFSINSGEIVAWDISEEKSGTSQPTKNEIDAELAKLVAEYEANSYQRDRQYPSIGDQLDMQYWDQVNGTTTWKDAIAKVKADHPKP